MTETPALLADRADALAAGADPDLLTDRLLDAASRQFRAVARHPITPTVHREVLPVHRPDRVLLPHRPVLHVVEVLRPSETRPPRPVLGWRLDADSIDLTGVRMPGWPTDGPPHTLRVEWTAGFDPVPEDVRWTVAQMVARAAQTPPPGMATGTPRITMTTRERHTAHAYRPPALARATTVW